MLLHDLFILIHASRSPVSDIGRYHIYIVSCQFCSLLRLSRCWDLQSGIVTAKRLPNQVRLDELLRLIRAEV